MSISVALSELVAALTEHAEIMSEQDIPPERAVHAIERVRVAALRYSDETFESSGWGSPFSDIFQDEEEDDSEDNEHAEDGTGPVPDEVERISITGRWDFVVADQEAWIGHVLGQLEDLGAPDCAVELNSGSQAAHELLSHITPFDAFTAHGLTDGGQDWVIEQIPKTLSEMTEEERYA